MLLAIWTLKSRLELFGWVPLQANDAVPVRTKPLPRPRPWKTVSVVAGVVPLPVAVEAMS